MQRSGAATRRFYAAFYQWTVRSANPTKRCAGTTSTLVPRRKQSTAPGARGDSRAQRHNESIGTTVQLRTEDVQSTAARPTGSLDLWEHAVRDKSEKSVTVELAVPSCVLRAENVAKRAQVHEVRMSTPLLREDAGDDELCTVLLEGDYSDVQAVWRNMYNTGSGQSTAAKEPTPTDLEPMLRGTQQSSADNHQHGVMEKDFSLPSPFWQPIGIEGAIEYFQTRLGLHAGMLEAKGPNQYVQLRGSRDKVLKADRFLEKIRSRELLGVHHKGSSDATEKQAEIIRQTDLASDDLRVWQSVTRKRLEGQTEVDYCLPERTWQRIVQSGGAEGFRTRFSVDIDPLETSGGGKKRCVSLKGDVAHMERAKGYLEGFRVNIPELQVDKDYLEIYSAVTGLHTAKDVAHREVSPKVQEKVVDSEQTPQPASADVHERVAKTVYTHFAWLSVPIEGGMEHALTRSQRQVIGSRNDCFVSQYNRVTEAKGTLQLLGTEHTVQSGLEEVQRLVDGHRERLGKAHAKIELIDTGLLDNMPNTQTMKQSIRERAAASSDGQDPTSVEKNAAPKAEVPRVQLTHYAWMRFPSANGLAGKVRAVRGEITTKTGCKMSNFFPDGKTEQVLRLLGDEKAISGALEAVQQVAANEAQKSSGRPADRVEIIEMGLRKDMVDFDTFRQSRKPIKTEDDATPPEQPPSLSQQTSSGKKAEEQTKKAASSLSSGKSSGNPSSDDASGSDAKRAEENSTQEYNQQLSDGIRSALRHITQPVALVTSFMPQSAEQNGDLKHKLARGVTVSSFCTVTLHPVPVVSFNLRVPSRSWDAISASGHFRVHLLKASPEGATAAHAFTLPYEQPHEPFEYLNRSGAFTKYGERTKNPAVVPRIKWAEAIHADFVAKVLPEKCITVGDHVIVVAEVTKISSADGHALSDTGALAYGMKGYRQLGNEIEPMELKAAEQEPSKTKSASPEVVAENIQSIQNVPIEAANITSQESAVGHFKSDENAPNDVAQDDLVDFYERFSTELDDEEPEATATPVPSSNSAKVALPDSEAGVSQQEESAPKGIEDLGPSSPLLDEESLQRVLEEDEASYSTKGLPSQTAANNPLLAEALNAVAGAYDHTPAPTSAPQPKQKSETRAPPGDHSTNNTTPETRPDNVFSNVKRPWGIEGSMTHQIRKMSIYHNHPRRHYSTDSPPPPISKKLLKTTVSDYLAQVPTHRKRYTNLIKLQRHAERLEAQLQNSKTLSPEEATTLSTEVSTARRRVSRELALRNAHDLRAMLDKGRVAAERAQWLESNLEQGQAVLLDEAKLLRRKLEDGGLRLAEFEEAKAGLTRDYEFVDAQLMRLRDFADEDDVLEMEDEEEGEEVAEREKERASD